MKCPKCGELMAVSGGNTVSVEVIREYRCGKCGHKHVEAMEMAANGPGTDPGPTTGPQPSPWDEVKSPKPPTKKP